MSRRAHIVTGIIFATVFICCVGAVQGWWWGESEPEPPPIAEQAQNVCYDAILEELKAPSSAELIDIGSYPEENDHWIVFGSVDAQNSFGTMLRTEFTCDIYQSGDQWRIASIEIT